MKAIMKVFLALTMVFILGCSNSKAITPTWKALSEVQLNNFLEEKKISPIQIKSTETTTIVFYETYSGHGYYQLSSDENGKIMAWESSTGSSEGINEPVSLEYFGSSDPQTVSYATVYIRDKTVAQKAYLAEIVFDGKYISKEYFNGKNALLIINDSKNRLIDNVSLKIYDKQNKLLVQRN